MYFKNEGFTLIEAMLAVLIIGMVLTPLFFLENTVVEGVGKSVDKFRLLLVAQNFLYEARRQQPTDAQEFNLEQKDNESNITVRYVLKKASDKSVFKKKNNLYQETVTATSPLKHLSSQKVVSFIFKPQKVQS